MQESLLLIDSLFLTFHSTIPEKKDIEVLEKFLTDTTTKGSYDSTLKGCIILCSYYAFADQKKFEEWINILKNNFTTGSIEYEAWANLYLARLNQIQDNIPETMRLYRKAAASGEEGFHRIQAQAQLRLANLYNNFGAFDEAIHCYLDCIDLCRQLNNIRSEVLAMTDLSLIYLTNNQAKKALEICRDALILSSRTNDRTTIMRLYIRECTILLELGNIEDVFNKLNSIEDEIKKYPSTLGSVNTIKGKAYRLQKKYPDSESEFEKALEISRQSTNPKMVTNALQQLVELYIEIGSYPQAWKHLDEAKELALKTNYQYGITTTLELSVELYQKQGEFDKALTAFREFYDMKQKMLSQQAERRMELLRIEHQVKQKEQEAELYRLKSEQLEKQLMERTTHLVSQAETVSRFRDDLRHILIEAKDPILGLREVKQKLKELPQVSIDWDEYDRNFSQVHPQFKQRLTERFPSITQTELKVCALMRMGLSSKETARLLTVDERSVENYRYRLRKKFALGKENLTSFLSNF